MSTNSTLLAFDKLQACSLSNGYLLSVLDINAFLRSLQETTAGQVVDVTIVLNRIRSNTVDACRINIEITDGTVPCYAWITDDLLAITLSR